MKNKFLNVCRKILLVISLSAGICMILIGVNYMSEGAIPMSYTGAVEDASFGADYYTLTYKASIEEINALRIISNGTQYTANNLVIIIRILSWFTILIGVLVSLFSMLFLLEDRNKLIDTSVCAECEMPNQEEEIKKETEDV